MARVTGPLHSDTAGGLYGGPGTGIVFSNWWKKPYVRRYALRVKQPETIKQQAKRAVLACANALWHSLTLLEKEAWQAIGAAEGLPGWQAFSKYNLRQSTEGWAPQKTQNDIHTPNTETSPTLTALVQDNTIIASWTETLPTTGNTTVLCAGNTNTFEVSMACCVWCSPSITATKRQATLRLKFPGIYYLALVYASATGALETPVGYVGPLTIV